MSQNTVIKAHEDGDRDKQKCPLLYFTMSAIIIELLNSYIYKAIQRAHTERCARCVDIGGLTGPCYAQAGRAHLSVRALIRTALLFNNLIIIVDIAK